MPEPAAAPDRPEPLPELFRAVTRQLRRQSRQALARWELTPSQARALGTLVRHGSMRVGALADLLHIAPRSATELVDDLSAAGLAFRSPDPADRRAVLVDASDHGKRVAARIRAASGEAGDAFFAHLDDADRADLARILEKLRDSRG